ncbi:MAG: NAD(P)-dependent oxidoreductase [Bryobacterales bacterium]|nr:NAD(P)-dependent oxidoreductase [Bryobacterales bacterium]
MAEKPIGLFGVGLLGSAIADRLSQASQPWIGFDPLRPEFAPNPEWVLEQADTLILCLPDSHVTAGLLPSIPATKLIIDTTTGDPAEMADFAAQRTTYLDVTIGGSSAHLRAGQALLMAGGLPSAYAAARPVLEKLSDKIFYCGPPGSGARMKLAFNLVLGLNRAALAEGLAFAEHAGLDTKTTLEVLQSGPAASVIMERKGPKMLTRDYTPEARLAQHHKDVRIILATAEGNGIALPLTQAHNEILAQAEALGFAECDNSALIEAYRSDSVVNQLKAEQ